MPFPKRLALVYKRIGCIICIHLPAVVISIVVVSAAVVTAAVVYSVVTSAVAFTSLVVTITSTTDVVATSETAKTMNIIIMKWCQETQETAKSEKEVKLRRAKTTAAVLRIEINFTSRQPRCCRHNIIILIMQ